MMLVESEVFFYQDGHPARVEANAAAYKSKASRSDFGTVPVSFVYDRMIDGVRR
jgi:hypothetical protein